MQVEKMTYPVTSQTENGAGGGYGRGIPDCYSGDREKELINSIYWVLDVTASVRN
jgi:hypothetical protein